ncbi:hypothetical protein FRC03_009182 [Tulasnella sp. 419]|nr:hypothetical protein FRC02_009573 [Tulasnella sp. 418]KAG8958397.1 hypothetical protein FRC03_009182 [Tulasnella sp. 419]
MDTSSLSTGLLAGLEMEALMDMIVTKADHLHGASESRVKYIRELPKLLEQDIEHPDDTCPICQDTFLSAIAVEEMAHVMDTPSLPEEHLGVTKLPCGHKFCRKDISIWITSSHDTCPSCRASLPIPTSPTDEDEEIDLTTWTEDERQILEAASRLARAAARRSQSNGIPETSSSGSTRPNSIGTPFTIGLAPVYHHEYDEDRSSFGMYS